MARIAINGFGRIGRLFFRATFGNPGLEIVAINDLGDIENLAYLLKYDTVYGRYDKGVRCQVSGIRNTLVVQDKEVQFFQVKEPLQLPWKDLQIDIVVEATGVFDSYEKPSCISIKVRSVSSLRRRRKMTMARSAKQS